MTCDLRSYHVRCKIRRIIPPVYHLQIINDLVINSDYRRNWMMVYVFIDKIKTYPSDETHNLTSRWKR